MPDGGSLYAILCSVPLATILYAYTTSLDDLIAAV